MVLDNKPTCKKCCLYNLSPLLSDQCFVLSRNTLIHQILWQIEHNVEKGAWGVEICLPLRANTMALFAKVNAHLTWNKFCVVKRIQDMPL